MGPVLPGKLSWSADVSTTTGPPSLFAPIVSPANVIVTTVLPGMVPDPAVVTLTNVNNALLVSKAHVPVTDGILQLNSGTCEMSKKPFAKYFTMIWPPGATAPPTLVRKEIVADESSLPATASLNLIANSSSANRVTTDPLSMGSDIT